MEPSLRSRGQLKRKGRTRPWRLPLPSLPSQQQLHSPHPILRQFKPHISSLFTPHLFTQASILHWKISPIFQITLLAPTTRQASLNPTDRVKPLLLLHHAVHSLTPAPHNEHSLILTLHVRGSLPPPVGSIAISLTTLSTQPYHSPVENAVTNPPKPV